MRPFECTLRLLRRAAEADGGLHLADGTLLDRFHRSRDEAAFECLVWRHGPAVFGVCRRVLRDDHEAEDAFQAAFLALARRGHTIAGRESIGGWLARVAYRCALARRAQRPPREQPLDDLPADSDPAAEAALRELRALVNAEVGRLPERFRLPVVLCHFAGHSNAEAARLLGCAVGTIESRLTRARQRLRVALARRGLAGVAGFLAASEAPAAVPAAWVAAAVRSAAGRSVPIETAILTQEVLRAMQTTKRRSAALALAAALAVTAGGWALANQAPKPAGEQPAQPPAKPAAPAKAEQTFAGTFQAMREDALWIKGGPEPFVQRVGRTSGGGEVYMNTSGTLEIMNSGDQVWQMTVGSGPSITRIKLPKSVRYSLDGKECRADDLQEGMEIRARLDKDAQGEPRMTIDARTRDPEFLVQAVDPAKRIVKLVVPGSKAPVIELTLPEKAPVTFGEKPQGLGELKAGTRVVIEMAADGTTVKAIRVVKPSDWVFPTG